MISASMTVQHTKWLQEAIARATAYSREHFENPPEISNWTWTP
jgi:hypothetical protein